MGDSAVKPTNIMYKTVKNANWTRSKFSVFCLRTYFPPFPEFCVFRWI